MARIESTRAQLQLPVNLSAVQVATKRYPQAGLKLNSGFVEIGSYALTRLRRKPIIEFYARNAPPTSKKERNGPGKPGRDPLGWLATTSRYWTRKSLKAGRRSLAFLA